MRHAGTLQATPCQEANAMLRYAIVQCRTYWHIHCWYLQSVPYRVVRRWTKMGTPWTMLNVSLCALCCVRTRTATLIHKPWQKTAPPTLSVAIFTPNMESTEKRKRGKIKVLRSASLWDARSQSLNFYSHWITADILKKKTVEVFEFSEMLTRKNGNVCCADWMQIKKLKFLDNLN